MIMSEICWNSFGKKRKDTLQDCIGAGIWLLIQMCRLMKQQFEDYNDFVELNSEDNFFLCNYFFHKHPYDNEFVHANSQETSDPLKSLLGCFYRKRIYSQ